MENYKPNSHKSKSEEAQTERPKFEKVIRGNAKVKEKSGVRKFTDVFISEDASSVKSYIFADVLVPAVKKLVSDIVKDGIEIVLYGGTSGRNRRSGGSRADYISYDRFSDRRDDRRDYREPRTKTAYSYKEVVLDNRGDAEEVLDRMYEALKEYRAVTVADFYDILGVSHDYTDRKYGWIDLSNARVVRVRDGYAFDLPKAMPID